MITSTANQQMKHISLLMKKAKERKEQGVFVAEGPKMFLEAPFEWLKHVYISESFYQVCKGAASGAQEGQKQKVWERLKKVGYEIVSDAVLKSISDTQTPQGILMVIAQPAYTLQELLSQPDTAHLLILENIQDPGNLGTMMRTGEGAGITGILMNRTSVDLFNPKTIRSTMGSIYRVPFLVVDDLAQTMVQLKEQQIHIYAAHLKGTLSYDKPNYREKTAFLIGNEGNGLSDEIADLADTYIKIPMQGQVESLNAAICASLLMYEAGRQRRE